MLNCLLCSRTAERARGIAPGQRIQMHARGGALNPDQEVAHGSVHRLVESDRRAPLRRSASVVLMLFGPSVSGTHISIISRELLIQNLNSY